VIAMAMGSCQKFLETAPQTSLTTGNAYNSAQDIENAIAGCYQIFMGADYYQWENVMLSDNVSDNAYPGGGGEATFVEEDQFDVPASNSHIYADWGFLYQGIARCNLLLNNINGATGLSVTRKAQIIGEASFLRAFNYFQLVKLWGGVPIELESNTADPKITRRPRSTEKQVYDQINSDLQVALANLPDTYGSDASVNKVRATKGAANALLAKIWAQRSDRDYNKVLGYCNAVINSAAGYSLVSNYASLFDGTNYESSESIMEIPFAAGGPNASWGVELFLAPEDGWQKYCVPSHDLANAFAAAGDKVREDASILFVTKDVNGNPIAWADENWNPCQDPTKPTPFAYKQKHPNGWSSGDHFYLLRLDDIILLAAEANNQLGNTAAAVTLLNQIRTRVGLANTTAATQSALTTAILNERRLELAFEAQRWDDLVRLGVATTVMTSLKEVKYTCNNGTPSAPIPIVYKCDKNHWLMPIPLTEMNNNPNLTQNPGY
ncbi:MAG: RagB/SusD family nutrient uptake outer membrane protein, partial [Sphingobacteriales bacterium]